jgi:cysteinyl-tRNA synthetase
MKLYNTLSGTKEEIERPTGRPLHIFVCGPTVYDVAHIGHARTYIAFDAFVRYLRASTWDVLYIQNITDVDDKVIVRAQERGEDPLAFARGITRGFVADMRALNIRSVSHYAPASKFIPAIIRQIETLRAKGFTYTIDGDGIYYDIARFPEYGKLSRRTAAQAEDSMSRIDESIAKRNRGDFCLWKFPKVAPTTRKTEPKLFTRRAMADGEPAWFTSLGWGRPGWHIEDTAISESYFGPQYDIHGGGIDIKFPHHEAEIAQQEAASGKKPFVRIWMHTGSLLVTGKKMSKSLGNYVTIQDFLKDHAADTLRFITLSHHYRSPINYTEELATQARASLSTLEVFLAKLMFAARASTSKKPNGAAQRIANDGRNFSAALNDDFNSPAALAVLFNLVTREEKGVWTLTRAEARSIARFLSVSLTTLGFSARSPVVPKDVQALANERELCRGHKQFTQADELRKRLNGLGYEVDDTPLGPFVRHASAPRS